MHFAYVAPTVPASMTPQAVSSRRGVGRNSHVSLISSSCTPRASATMVTAAPQPNVNNTRALEAALIVQRLAEPEQLAHVELDRVSRVVGDLDPTDGVHLVRHRHER